MKKIAHLFLFGALLLSFTAQAEELFKYKITSTSRNKTLKQGEAVFVFNFIERKNGISAPLKKVTIDMSYNGTDQELVTTDKGFAQLKVKPGKYIFQFYYNEYHREVETDSIVIKPGYQTNINVYFNYSRGSVKAKKPVIYLYPEKPTEVSLTLAIQGDFQFTYPVYNEGWTVTANPDGKLQQGDKTFNYLFWEGESALVSGLESQEGFVKNTYELTGFFEEKLAHLGLNSAEIQDYITYWVPQMQEHEKHYIRFILNDEYNKTANITVNPQPDQMIRVFMLWTPLQKGQNIEVKAPQLPSFKRHGFTLVEWGGAEIKLLEP